MNRKIGLKSVLNYLNIETREPETTNLS